MRNFIFIFLFCIIMPPGHGQKLIEKHMDFSQKNSLILDIQIADSICIHAWNKKEVFTKATVDVNDNKDNDAYKTRFDESGNDLRVEAKFEQEYMNRNHNFTTNIAWDVYIPEGISFSVKTINGNIIFNGNAADIKLKSISGNIIITGKNTSVDANSISGFVDLSVASDLKADLEFKTISGTIYSNHEIAPKGKSKEGTNNVSDALNGGGIPIKLKTISGNIYFRKI